MLRRRFELATRFVMRAIASVCFCAGLIGIALPAKSYAQTPAAQAEPMSAETLKQHGVQLHAEIDATYQQLRASKTLSNRVRQGNDVTDVVGKYIPVGIRFDEAEAILRAAGCIVGISHEGHLFGRSTMNDRTLDIKHTFEVDLAPQSNNGISMVSEAHATIFTKYVPKDSK
jgi:hypothetical protein